MNKTSRKTFQFSVTQKKVSLKEFYRIFGNAALSNGIFEPLKLSEIEDFFAFELPKFVVDSLRASREFVSNFAKELRILCSITNSRSSNKKGWRQKHFYKILHFKAKKNPFNFRSLSSNLTWKAKRSFQVLRKSFFVRVGPSMAIKLWKERCHNFGFRPRLGTCPYLIHFRWFRWWTSNNRRSSEESGISQDAACRPNTGPKTGRRQSHGLKGEEEEAVTSLMGQQHEKCLFFGAYVFVCQS